MTTISPLGANPAAASGNSERAQLAAASRQFEAIFVRQMLSAARQASFGDQLFGNEGTATFREMQDSNYADVAAQTGAFGLAAQIEAQLARTLPSANGGGA